MRGVPAQAAPAPRPPECTELEAYRLERDWTWDQLSADMRRRGVPMSPRTLHYIIKRAPADHVPLDRTLYKIRKFLSRTRATRTRVMKGALKPGKSAVASV